VLFRSGTRTKLSPALPAGGQVETGLAVSADGTRVLYRANMDTDDDGDIDLYAVDLAKPGVAVKVNGQGSALAGMAISGDGKRAAYIGEYNDGKSFRQNAFTVDLSAAQPGDPQQLGESVQNINDLQLSQNGKRVVLRADDSGTHLFAFDTAEPGVEHRISNSDGGEGNVEGYQLAADGSAVVYVSSPFFSDLSMWRAPLAGTGAYESTELVDGEAQGGVERDLALSPDAKLVYFRKRDADGSVPRLCRVDVTKPKQVARLSDAGNGFDVAVGDFALSRDGKGVAFRANLPTPEVRGRRVAPAARLPNDFTTPELRFIDLSKTEPAASILLNPAVPEGRDGVSGGYQVTNDRRVLFPGDFDAQFVRDVYVVSAGTPGTLRKVSPARAQTSDDVIVSALSLF
jgi:Tol biopolymer transport system component